MSKAKLDICTKSNINQARHDKPSSQKRYKKYFPTNQSMSLLTNVFPMKNQLKNKKKLMRNNLSLRSKQQRSVSFSIKKFRTTRATIQSRLQRKIRKNKTINRKYSLQSAITHNRNASHVKRNSILGTTTRLSIKKTRTKGISNNTSLAQINSNTAFHYKQQQSTCENLTPLIYIQKQQNVTNITNRALLQDLNRLDRYWDENSDQIVKVIDRVEQKRKTSATSMNMSRSTSNGKSSSYQLPVDSRSKQNTQTSSKSNRGSLHALSGALYHRGKSLITKREKNNSQSSTRSKATAARHLMEKSSTSTTNYYPSKTSYIQQHHKQHRPCPFNDPNMFKHLFKLKTEDNLTEANFHQNHLCAKPITCLKDLSIDDQEKLIQKDYLTCSSLIPAYLSTRENFVNAIKLQTGISQNGAIHLSNMLSKWEKYFLFCGEGSRIKNVIQSL